MLRAVNEHDFRFPRMIRDDTARGAVLRFVERLHFSRSHLDLLDSRAVEHAIDSADIIDDPATVGRPHVHSRQHMAVRRVRELAFLRQREGRQADHSKCLHGVNHRSKAREKHSGIDSGQSRRGHRETRVHRVELRVESVP